MRFFKWIPHSTEAEFIQMEELICLKTRQLLVMLSARLLSLPPLKLITGITNSIRPEAWYLSMQTLTFIILLRTLPQLGTTGCATFKELGKEVLSIFK